MILTSSIPVIDAQTGAEVGRGTIPPNSVAITATRPRRFGSHEYGLPCVLLIKHLAEGERHDKGRLEMLLSRARRHGLTAGRVGTDLLALTAELVDIASPRHGEATLTDHLQGLLDRHLEVLLERDQSQMLPRHHLVDRHPDAAGPHLDRAHVDVTKDALVVLRRRRHVGLHQVHQGEAREVADFRVHARRRAAIDERSSVLEHEVRRHAPPAGVEEEVIGRRELSRRSRCLLAPARGRGSGRP